jgi:hypothetical protein
MVPTASEAGAPQREHLWHACSTHPLEGQGPCVPGVCVAFCGLRYPEKATHTYIECGDEGPSDCVVCTAMFEQRFGA